MFVLRKKRQLYVLSAIFLLSLTSALSAAEVVTAPVSPVVASAQSVVSPDPNANPILVPLIKAGAKFYYMGNRSGLDGWFAMKDNRVQVLYTTADKKNLLIGAMFGPDGENISGAQVNELFSKNKELSETLAAAVKSVTGAGSPSTVLPTPQPVGTSGPSQTSSAAPAASGATKAISPGEKLLQDLTNASGVDVGFISAPRVVMIMDPNCPHCQAAWRSLRVPVFKNALRVRLVPIAPPDSDDERAAGQLLTAADPLGSWDKYVAGDKSQLAGMPDKALIKAVQVNHELIDSWGVRATPYLVYRAKDGRVKIVEGEPDKVDAIVTDLAP